MCSVSERDYAFLRGALLDYWQSHASKVALQTFKHLYEDNIRSNRRLECVTSLAELLVLLEKRACVSPRNILILHEIAQNLNCDNLLNAIQNRADLPKPNEKALPVQLTVQPLRNCPIGADPSVRERVHSLICSQLGKSWIDFARALDVQECKIDELKMNYCHQGKVCTKEILSHHEQNAHPRLWQTQLLEALTKARRNDLRKAVQDIFDTYS